MRLVLLMALFSALTSSAGAQHTLSVFSGGTWYPTGTMATGSSNTVVAYTLGFSYAYWFTESWSVATFDDIDFVHAFIEREDENGTVEILEREFVKVFTAGFEYKFTPEWTLYAGGGMETDAHRTLPVIRLTTEYAVVTQNSWEGMLSASAMHKESYFVFSLGLALALNL